MSAVVNMQVVLNDVRKTNIQDIERAVAFGLKLDQDESHLLDEIFNINILRDKTIYEDTSNGLFRFGDINLTSEEFDLIQEMVDNSFRETLQDNNIYDKALINSKTSIIQLLQPIIGDEFKINISFK